MIGRKVHKVVILQEYAGEEIEIRFTGAKNGSAIDPGGLYFGSYQEVAHQYVVRRNFVLLGGLFLLAFGGMFLLLYLLARDAHLRERNAKENRPWNYSAAWGYALSTEADSFHDVYLLADQRMYDNKKEMKQKNSA